MAILDSLMRQWNGFEDFNVLNFSKILLKIAIVFKFFDCFCPFLSLTIITSQRCFSSLAAIFRWSAGYIWWTMCYIKVILNCCHFKLKPASPGAIAPTLFGCFYVFNSHTAIAFHCSLLVERVFSLIRSIKLMITPPHSQKWLPHFEIDVSSF